MHEIAPGMTLLSFAVRALVTSVALALASMCILAFTEGPAKGRPMVTVGMAGLIASGITTLIAVVLVIWTFKP